MSELDKLVEHIKVAEKALLWADKRIRELEAERQWQPIETAPKDGTDILISNPKKWLYLRIAYWRKTQKAKNWKRGWFVEDGYDYNNASHWMPLPELPAD